MRTLRIGIATYEEMKARTMVIASGDLITKRTDPKVWFPSMESAGKVLSSKNKTLLEVIATRQPCSIEKLAKLTGRQKSSVSRTLHTLRDTVSLPSWKANEDVLFRRFCIKSLRLGFRWARKVLTLGDFR
jgi:predicted transcriptional regulator